MRTAFVSQINAWLKNKGLYKKNESAITFADVQDCLVLVSSSFSTRTSYENQTKKAITNKFVAQAMTEFLKHQLEVYFIEHPDEAEKACKQVLINKQSREHAEKARITIKKTMTQQMDLANRVQKFVDCRTKDASRRELYIVEGDSAMGAVKQSRDSEFQAIMPIRGKILNCLKADYARIFKSEIITDLIRVMGCGVELGGSHNKDLASFNLDNLRFNKVVICTDADVDGYQIRTLVLTMLYRLTPTLINKGYVYRRVAAVRDQHEEQDLFCVHRAGEGRHPAPYRRREIHDPALERSGRERPRDDVADDDEPRQPPPDQGAAHRRRAHLRRV